LLCLIAAFAPDVSSVTPIGPSTLGTEWLGKRFEAAENSSRGKPMKTITSLTLVMALAALAACNKNYANNAAAENATDLNAGTTDMNATDMNATTDMNAGGAMNSTDLNGAGTMNAVGNTGNSM
jgi:hypothetical protein